MGAYIVRSNIEAIFGVRNVALWSNLDNDDAATNEARVTAAIEFAEGYIDDRLRDGRYAVPLTGTAAALTVIRSMAAQLAGWWLYRTRGIDEGDGKADRLTAAKAMVDELLSDYHTGRMRLDVALAHSDMPTAPEVV